VQAGYVSTAHGGEVELFHAVYTGKPRRGHSLITYGNNLYDPDKARVLASSTRHVDLAGGLIVNARELRLADAEGPRLVWYWYCVARHCSASPVLAKLQQAWVVLRGGNPRSSVWALSVPVAGGNADQARANLHDFARALPATGEAKP
jgi:EpsI family protein